MQKVTFFFYQEAKKGRILAFRLPPTSAMQRNPSHINVVGLTEDMCSAAAEAAVQKLVGQTWEVIPERLSFSIHRDDDHTMQCIRNNPKTFYFSSWMQESYLGFCSDFGPVNLAAVVRFCRFLRDKLVDPRLANRPLVYYCDANTAFLTNTAFLLGAYLVLVEKWAPELAAQPFESIQPSPFRMFRDATFTASTFDLGLVDCLRGLGRAVEAGWLDYEGFDVEEYELLEDVETADLHVVCPKFVALRGPAGSGGGEGWARPPQDYVPLLKALRVSAVVRLNEAETYDRRAFTAEGIRHHDLYFDDCTAPSAEVVAAFHATCRREAGVVAVHCTAGLGRTGTLIATWIMKEHGWSAREAMAWLRIVRPGSVIGPQQHFLDAYQHQLAGREAVTGCNGAGCSAAHSQLLAAQISEACRARGGHK